MAMVASIPETEKSIFSRRVMYRAAQQVTHICPKNRQQKSQ